MTRTSSILILSSLLVAVDAVASDPPSAADADDRRNDAADGSQAVTSEVSDTPQIRRPRRTYEILVSWPSDDLRLISRNATTLDLAVGDLYYRALSPQLPTTLGRIGGEVWSFCWTYIFTIWPHELGHWMRAREVGGRFNIHDYSLPVPWTTMDLPADVSKLEEALVSVAGFEINLLMATQQRRDFYLRGEAGADTLAHTLVQRSFFPIYALIFPSDPDDPNTWIRTRGDPVHVVLPTYERHTGRPPIRSDGSVDPELSRHYKETVLASLIWPLLDPFTFAAGRAMLEANGAKMHESSPLIGDRDMGWTYGTLFAPTPLGYALHLTNALWLREIFIEIDAHYGRPAKNVGLGVVAPALIQRGPVKLGVGLETWDQAEFGFGGAASASVSLDVSKGVGLNAELRAKTRGYTLGAPIDSGISAFFSATFSPFGEW